MKDIKFSIDETKKTFLEEQAKYSRISVDELINIALDHYFHEKQKKFEAAREYTLNRYKELYKRLA